MEETDKALLHLQKNKAFSNAAIDRPFNFKFLSLLFNSSPPLKKYWPRSLLPALLFHLSDQPLPPPFLSFYTPPSSWIPPAPFFLNSPSHCEHHVSVLILQIAHNCIAPDYACHNLGTTCRTGLFFFFFFNRKWGMKNVSGWLKLEDLLLST